MPQFIRSSILNEDQQIIKTLICKLKYFPKLELVAKLNTFLPLRTHIWSEW